VNILRDEGFGDDGERKGVVHSFTGSVEEVVELVSSQSIIDPSNRADSDAQMDMGFHIRCGFRGLALDFSTDIITSASTGAP
jgi:hypothetical protein